MNIIIKFYWVNPDATPKYQRTQSLRFCLISIKRHLPLQGEIVLFVKIRVQEEIGHHIIQVVVTLGLLWIIKYYTMYTLIPKEMNGFVIQ